MIITQRANLVWSKSVLFKRPSFVFSYIRKSTDVVQLALNTYRKGRHTAGDIKRIMEDKQSQLKHHNYRQRLGGKLPVPSKIELFVLGSGNRGTTKSIVVDMDYFKYVFNCGEGTQRIITEHKLKITRLEDIFITNYSWDNVSGMTGLCLTLQDSSVPFVKVYGPPKIDNLMNISKTFAQLGKIKLDFTESKPSTVKDEAMAINIIPIYPADSEPDHKKFKLEDSTVQSNNQQVAVVYVCKPHRKPRSIDMEKCVNLNIPRDEKVKKIIDGEEKIVKQSPMKRIIEGETVELPDGKIITIKDILSPPQNKKYFIVVDCPTEDFIDPLINSNLHDVETLSKEWPTVTPEEPPDVKELPDANFKPLLEEDPDHGDIIVDVIVHFSPLRIVQSERYQNWMKKFGENTKHMLLNEQCSESVMTGLFELQAKLNLLHEGIFPLLPQQIKETNNSHAKMSSVSNMMNADPGMRYIFRGQKQREGQYESDTCINLDNKEFVKEVLTQKDFQQELALLKTKLANIQTDKAVIDSRLYPEIVFLGTGSCLPSKVRNVSAILVHLSANECMLLDCGEDTYGQLYRHYADKTDEILSKLKAVFISHLHADHHMGLTTVVHKRNILLEKQGKTVTPLEVIAPARLRSWVNDMEENGIPLKQMISLVPCEGLVANDDLYDTNSSRIQKCIGVKNIETCRVFHRQFPHGVKLTLSNNYTLVYSGDTMPCVNLEKLGKGCDLLIHEATMEDDLIEDAKAKNHSITSDAIQSGVRMNAGFILLTHFSQRYAKIPMFNDKFTDTVGIAFDNMRIRPCDLHLLPLFRPALKALFAEHYAEMEEKLNTRTMKKKLKAEMRKKKLAEGGDQPSEEQNKNDEKRRQNQGKRKNRKKNTADTDVTDSNSTQPKQTNLLFDVENSGEIVLNSDIGYMKKKDSVDSNSSPVRQIHESDDNSSTGSDINMTGVEMENKSTENEIVMKDKSG